MSASLTAALLNLLSLFPGQGEVPSTQVRARAFQVHYRASDESLPLTLVELWYSTDREQVWHRFGEDDDRQSPFPFTAAEEGLYGLYVVLKNQTGASSQPPVRGSQPHLRVFVDYTPPTVQMHPPRPTRASGQRIVQIRWTAVDAHLDPRPVELSYRLEPAREYEPLTTERQSNSGQFDWRVPDELAGTVQFRVIVHDRAGNVTEATSEPLDLPEAAWPPASDPAPGQPVPADGAASAAAERARRLLKEARMLRAAGDSREALARLREAVRLSPSDVEAIAALGGVLYDMKDAQRALETFELALAQNPDCRTALEGVARIRVERLEYSAAAEPLERMLSSHPRDARTWMFLGDVALKQGDEIRARECYHRAATVDAEAVDVAAEVQKRLENMEALSQRFRRADASP